MSGLTLVIGNKNYSSWSLRPWLVLRMAGIPFREIKVLLDQPDTREKIAPWSPSGRVPALVDGDVRVWDSLAICEYLAEKFPEAKLWPAEPAARARARSISAEMHSGFQALRNQFTMDVRGRRETAPSPETRADIDRISTLWRECRQAVPVDAGPFLFGSFTIADAMYAPVATRFRTYGVPLDGICGAYRDALLNLAPFKEWEAEALGEPVMKRYAVP